MLDFNHIYKVLATSILETIAPSRCVVCDMPGEILCPQCANALPYIDLALACPRCAAPYGHVLCTECPLPGSEEALARPQDAFAFAAARAALSFEAGAKKIVRAYKDADELRLDAVIASLMVAAMRGRQGDRGAPLLASTKDARRVILSGASRSDAKSKDLSGLAGSASVGDSKDSSTPLAFARFAQNDEYQGSVNEPPDDWTQWADAIVAVPASPEAVLRRGFDHMQRVAVLCAQRTGLPLVDALVCSKRSIDQRELGRDERLANRRASFAVKDDAFARGTVPLVNRESEASCPARILLIDDVLTTGATAQAACEALLDAGAREVRVVTCCRVW